MILTFYRQIVRASDANKETIVIAKIVANDGELRHELGVLSFPNQTLWAKFFGSVQTGALRIRDLSVVMENSHVEEDKPLIEAVAKPRATTTVVGAIGGDKSNVKDTRSDLK